MNTKIFQQKLNYKLRSVSYVEIVELCTAVRDLSCMFSVPCVLIQQLVNWIFLNYHRNTGETRPTYEYYAKGLFSIYIYSDISRFLGCYLLNIFFSLVEKRLTTLSVSLSILYSVHAGSYYSSGIFQWLFKILNIVLNLIRILFVIS